MLNVFSHTHSLFCHESAENTTAQLGLYCRRKQTHVAAMLQRERDEPDKTFTNSSGFTFFKTGKFSAESCFCLDTPGSLPAPTLSFPVRLGPPDPPR